MKAFHALPAGYTEKLRIDLQKDKKTALWVNVGAAAAMVLVIAVGGFIHPLRELADLERPGAFFLRLGVLMLAYIAYIILHELTHAAVMKAVGGGKVHFGFTGMYAFAGSREDYFDKASYICIALAPLVLWGIIFACLSFAVPPEWFWVPWLLQAGNIGGAAGDVYVTGKMLPQPSSVLVMDTGVDMTVYAGD